jgi:O-antigen/teichoic acid export membrane protein
VASRLILITRTLTAAALLSPADLGAYTLALTVAVAADAGLNPGFYDAMLARIPRTQLLEATRTIWSLMIVRGLLIAGLVVAVAHVLQAWTGITQVTTVAPGFAIGLAAKSAINPQMVVDQRDGDVRAITRLQLAGHGTEMASLLILLTINPQPQFASLAFAIGHVTALIISLVVLPIALPKLEIAPLRTHLSFARRRTAANTLWTVGSQSDEVVGARWLGAVAVGQYGVAYRLANTAASESIALLFMLLLPRLAREADSSDSAGLISVAYLGAVTTSALGVLAFTMPIALRQLLGEDWIGLGPAIGVLCIGAALRLIGAQIAVIATAHGHAIVDVVLQATRAAVLVMALITIKPDTATSLAIVSTAALVASLPMTLISAAKCGVACYVKVAFKLGPQAIGLALIVIAAASHGLTEPWRSGLAIAGSSAGIAACIVYGHKLLLTLEKLTTIEKRRP